MEAKAGRKIRKPPKNHQRKGLPANCNPLTLIEDEEYLLSQTARPKQNAKLTLESARVQRWFVAEYFYSQMDRAFFTSNDFARLLESLQIGNSELT